MEQPSPSSDGAASTAMTENPHSTTIDSLPRQSSTRACAMCVKAKAKCTPHREIEGICQRCHRLKKQCFLHVRPSRKRTRTLKPTRVAQLEQKLDGLVTLLTTSQPTLQTTSENQACTVSLPRSPVSCDSNEYTAGPSTAATQSIISDETNPVKSVNDGVAQFDLQCTVSAANLPIVTQEVSHVEPDERQAEILLLEFRSNMTEQFPFVVIRPEETSRSLRSEKPLLWKAIMVAAAHGNCDRQLSLGASLMEDITTRLLFRAEKSLHLLQALLVFIAWYHYHTLANPQTTNLLHLAKALINNMGLNRSQTAHDRGKFFLDGAHDFSKHVFHKSHGSEGWRALAGCFYLTCVMSASFRGLEPQFNTSYILEFCHKLEEAEEYESDVVLVHLVRLQEIRYRMGRSFPYDESNACRKPDAPVEMFVRAWRKELETSLATVPTKHQQNPLLLTTYHTIEIALYELYLSECPMCAPRNVVKVIDKSGKLEFTYASLIATRKVFDVYSSVPVEKVIGVCFTLWAQFNHAFINAIKLLGSDIDGWDLAHARSVLTFPDILHYQVKAIEYVISKRSLVLDPAMHGKDVFARLLTKLRHALRWYGSMTNSRLEPQGLTDQPTYPNGSLGTTDTGASFTMFDDAFWQNMFDDNWLIVGDELNT